MTEKLIIAQQVAEKFMKLSGLEKQFTLGYITRKRDQKEAKEKA